MLADHQFLEATHIPCHTVTFVFKASNSAASPYTSNISKFSFCVSVPSSVAGGWRKLAAFKRSCDSVDTTQKIQVNVLILR